MMEIGEDGSRRKNGKRLLEKRGGTEKGEGKRWT